MRRAARLAIPAAVSAVVAGLLALAPPVTPARSAVEAVPSARDQVRIRYPAGRYPTLTLPDGQVQTVRSLLNVTRPMRFGSYVWNDADVPQGPVWIRIDPAGQTLSVFRAGQEIGSAVILYGTDDKPTPSGIFPILQKAEQHRSTLYDAEMPFMLRLTGDGVAIHASDIREGSATHGCIGVPPEFARLLFSEVKRGDLVAILPSAVPPRDKRQGTI